MGRPVSARPASATRGGMAGSPIRRQRPTSAVHRRESTPSVTWSREVEGAAPNTKTLPAAADRISVTSTAGGSQAAGNTADLPADSSQHAGMLRVQSMQAASPKRRQVGLRSSTNRVGRDSLPSSKPPRGDLLAGLVQGHGFGQQGQRETGAASPLRRPMSARPAHRAHWLHGSGASEAASEAARRQTQQPGDAPAGSGSETGSVGGWTADTPSTRRDNRPRSASPRGRKRSKSSSIASEHMLELDIKV